MRHKTLDLTQAALGILAMVLVVTGGLLHVDALMAAGWVVVGLMALVLAYWVVRLVRLLLHLRWAQRVSREAAQRRRTGEFAGWEPK